MEISFQELEKEYLSMLDRNILATLATAVNGEVTARAMSIIRIGREIYFQCGKDSRKYAQMLENPKAALVCQNMQIEGIVRFGRQPLEEKEFIELYREKHRDSYNTYSFSRNNVTVIMKPSKVTFWKYINKHPHRDIADFMAEKATRLRYVIETGEWLEQW